MRIANLATGGMLTVLLAACQSLEPGKEARLQVTPVQDVKHSIPRPEAQYAIGRYLQGQLRHDEAVTTYRRLLETHPHHAEARNALGLTLAAQGKHALAIAEFERAVADAPDAVAMRNNLGYAHLLQKNWAQAIDVLEAARKIDPGNQRVLDNLAMASTGNASALAATSKAADIHMAADNLTTTDTRAPLPRLEVSNGNGITRLARETAQELAVAGYERPRLTNQPPYQLATTEIQYRPGFEAQAQRLRDSLRDATPLVPSSQLRWDVQLRLVLGKDVKTTDELIAPSKLL